MATLTQPRTHCEIEEAEEEKGQFLDIHWLHTSISAFHGHEQICAEGGGGRGLRDNGSMDFVVDARVEH